MNINAGMFKYPSLMGIFLIPPPSSTTKVAHINMISSFTSGSLISFSPWMVPCLKDVESYGTSLPLNVIDIVNRTIPSTSIDTGQNLHPHMECDQTSPLTWAVNSLCSHDFLDIDFPSEEAIL